MVNKTRRTRKPKTQNSRKNTCKKSNTTTGGRKISNTERQSAEAYDRAKKDKYSKSNNNADQASTCDEKYDTSEFCMDVFEERKKQIAEQKKQIAEQKKNCGLCKSLDEKKYNTTDVKRAEAIQNLYKKKCSQASLVCKKPEPVPELPEPVPEHRNNETKSAGLACSIL